MRSSYALLACMALLLAGCETVPTGPTQQESKFVEKDNSEKLHTRVEMGAGKLNIRGGASKWLQGDFKYNVPDWKPDVHYSSTSGTGDLTIQQSNTKNATNAVNEWDLQLNNSPLTDLTVHFGAGEANLNLGSLALRNIDLEMGAGQLKLDLRGQPTHSFDVRVRGGAGEATIYVPSSAGISAKATGGLGDISMKGLQKDGDRWVNDANGKAKVQINLDIEGGVGSIRVIAE